MVKKILIASALLLASMSASASNYLTLGVNDTVKILPNQLGSSFTQWLHTHFDGRLNEWCIDISCPSGLSITNSEEGPDMTLDYIDSNGQPDSYDVILAYHYVPNGIGLSVFVPEQGYWDYNEDDEYESYGTLKWEPGDFDQMVSIQFSVDANFTGGTIGVSGYVSSTNDNRGGIILTNPDSFQRTVVVKVGYIRGDVNGDGFVSVADVAALTGYLLNGGGLDQYQLEAADIDGNGLVNTADLGMLTNMLLNS